MTDINKTLSEREANYGTFKKQARKAQKLKDAMRYFPEFESLTDSQKEALDMIQHKIARILNGKGNNYTDNWHDIAGYATLVEKELLDNIDKMEQSK